MADEDVRPTAVSARAARPALIESFSLERLYGYRTISLSSEYAATVLIAKNGTGKTTLLAALDAFLRMQLTRLKDLPFSALRCRLRGVPDELHVTHEDITEVLTLPTDGELVRFAGRLGMDPQSLFNYVLNSFQPSPYENNYDEVVANIRRLVSYETREYNEIVERLRTEVFVRNVNVGKMYNSVKFALDGMDVVYLPTYRRVELVLTEDETRDRYGRRKPPRFSVAAGSLHTGDIRFGLSDISERLRVINNNITHESNNRYNEISANIINDLIDGSYSDHSIDSNTLPTDDELSLFFARLRQGRRMGSYPVVNSPNLEKLSARSAMPEASAKFLSYFLAQLGRVINASKSAEAPVDAFIDVCNKYLLSEEPSTEIGGGGKPQQEGKQLRVNRRDLSVHAYIVPEGKRITLDALSSGEKQMISMFARLFLYPKRKLVLIDEPELSLSIDWQSHILVDMLNAPLCDQVIAITHSPFVFENELDPFARALSVERDIAELPAVDADEDDVATVFDDGE